ncbi:quinoprotein relay system zinc metallohydrolase 2 [Methylobacterium radiodurans]|uniref:Quinoprotein relay system zinc metallohydrolase 2 n=1 Tax=Methylobacterium radiodurans TaxID=2202828 RepID=A0A2U8VSW9_9HYPH|nr:quinoprotein relay system zinc metallohydrolase 2 [Methylobacterium radiodurans]AWN36382.1 quinoprotein relay system zinc metallohydrolase 2 [Methylobacterium radiodurans]
MRAPAAASGNGARAALSRREALATAFGGFCLCCLPGRVRAEALVLEEVGPGVFVRRGPNTEAAPGNADAIANTGFIIGRDGVLVTESGGSLADGQWLRGEIRKRTDKPIRHVVMTHVHPDHCFGAAAFTEDKPSFIGHHALRAALEARGEYYRKRLEEVLGADKAGTVVYPTLAVTDSAQIDLGDRTLRVTAHPTAHTTCDLSMTDTGSGLLFTGDLLSVGRIPSLDGNLNGWLKEIERLKASGAAQAVPGHGPVRVDLVPALADLARYLGTLREETRKAIAADLSIEKAVATVAQSERGKWDLFDDYNARNVTVAYKELEWE